MSITFFSNACNHGLDDTVNPPWQMVPECGTRILTLRNVGSIIPRGRDPSILGVEQTYLGKNEWHLLLIGHDVGHTSVNWENVKGGTGNYLRHGATLEVSVKSQKLINTAFHYVTDGREQVTSRVIGDLDNLISGANFLLTPQANVTIIRKSAAILPISQDLGRVVRRSLQLTDVPREEDEWNIITSHIDSRADFNVFFVKEYEQDRTPYIDHVAAETNWRQKICIMEDKMSFSAAEVLAHETIHLLGVLHHSENKHHLIANANRIGQIITKEQANQINRSGT